MVTTIFREGEDMTNKEAIQRLIDVRRTMLHDKPVESEAIETAIEALRMTSGCKVEISEKLMKTLVRRGIEDAIRDFHEMGYTDEDIVLAMERVVEDGNKSN